jgi:hypothetical protein
MNDYHKLQDARILAAYDEFRALGISEHAALLATRARFQNSARVPLVIRQRAETPTLPDLATF